MAIVLTVMGVGGVTLVAMLIGALVFLGEKSETRFQEVGRGGSVDISIPPSTGGAPYAREDLVPEPIAAMQELCQQALVAQPVGVPAFPAVQSGGVGQYAQVVQLYHDGQSEWMATVDLADGGRTVPLRRPTTDGRGDETAQHSPVVVCSTPPEVRLEDQVVCVFNAPADDGTMQEHRVNRVGTSMQIEVFRVRDGQSLGSGEIITPAACGEDLDLGEPEAMYPLRNSAETWAQANLIDGGLR